MLRCLVLHPSFHTASGERRDCGLARGCRQRRLGLPNWVTGGKTRRELCSPDCLKERTLSGAHSIFSEATRTADSRVLGRAIPCSAVAQQRHKIIRNRLALLRDESVSEVTVGTAPTPTGDPLMRIYIIGKDGITLCRKAPATVNDGEIAVASNEELHAAPLSAKRRTSATSENKGRWQWQPGSARVSSRRTGFTSGIWRRGKGRHSQGRERLQSAPSRTFIGNTRFFPPAPWALT